MINFPNCGVNRADRADFLILAETDLRKESVWLTTIQKKKTRGIYQVTQPFMLVFRYKYNKYIYTPLYIYNCKVCATGSLLMRATGEPRVISEENTGIIIMGKKLKVFLVSGKFPIEPSFLRCAILKITFNVS